MRFKKLSVEDEHKFRQHARSNYTLFSEIEGIWHPSYQDECVKMNTEASTFVEESEE